jgi:hypothetical protein
MVVPYERGATRQGARRAASHPRLLPQARLRYCERCEETLLCDAALDLRPVETETQLTGSFGIGSSSRSADLACILAAASFVVASAGCATSEPTEAGCLLQPAIYDWQALDDRHLVVWPAPGGSVYEITLDHGLDGLAAALPGLLELIDGDQDGYICSGGFDSVVSWSSDHNQQDQVPVPVGAAEISAIEPLDESELNEKLNAYKATRGPRVGPDEVD